MPQSGAKESPTKVLVSQTLIFSIARNEYMPLKSEARLVSWSPTFALASSFEVRQRS